MPRPSDTDFHALSNPSLAEEQSRSDGSEEVLTAALAYFESNQVALESIRSYLDGNNHKAPIASHMSAVGALNGCMMKMYGAIANSGGTLTHQP